MMVMTREGAQLAELPFRGAHPSGSRGQAQKQEMSACHTHSWKTLEARYLEEEMQAHFQAGIV